jgi:hypothetical protein
MMQLIGPVVLFIVFVNDIANIYHLGAWISSRYTFKFHSLLDRKNTIFGQWALTCFLPKFLKSSHSGP